MTEQIELSLLNVSDTNINASDTEYHEIRNESFLGDTLVSPQTPVNLINRFDFFTQVDVKPVKKAGKKKKGRKKDSANLIDVINSELALHQTPLLENVITRMNYSEDQASYLDKTSNFHKIFRRNKTRRGDTENGYKTINLNPVFPRVLENAITKGKTITVQYVEPVMFDDILMNYQEHKTKRSPKFLEISIKDIAFPHHHDFSLEKLLCIKLIECFKDYCNVQNEIKVTIKNVEINKKTRDNLKHQLLNIGSTTKEELRYDPTILKYTGKFLSFKDKYYQLLNSEKEYRHKVLTLWADIEMIRQKSETINTAHVIQLTKTVLDDNDYEKEFMSVFEIEYSDMLDRLEYEYVVKYLEYKKLKQCYKVGDSDRKKILKPKINIEQDRVKDEVENIVNKIVNKEIVQIFLIEDKYVLRSLSNTLTSLYQYHFKIYVDNVFVCESETVTSNFLFNCIDFNDTLSIEILPNNEILTIFLCENDVKVALVVINISEVQTSSCNANFHTIFFTYNNIVEPSPRCVGSGFEIKEIVSKNKVRLKTSSLFKGTLYTTAVVNIKIGWSDKLNGNQCDSIQQTVCLGKQLKRLIHGNDKPKVEMLTDIIEKIYGKNLNEDTNIISAIQDVCKTTVVSESCMFGVDANSDEMIRLRLLHLRNCGGFDVVVDKTIPIFPSQISTEQLSCLKKSEEKEFELQLFKENTNVNSIDLQRFMSLKYVNKLNERLQKSLSDNLLRKTYKDVVRDFKDLSLRGIFSNKSNFEVESISSFAKQRILKECLTKDQEINIVVLRACNLLNRSRAIISEEFEDDDSIEGFKIRPLRPFVSVSYRGVSAQSTVAKGCYPTWNGTVKIKTKLAPVSSIHVNVYDECKVDISDAYSEEVHSSLSKSVHYRYYNKWLGTVKVPLFTVLSLGSIRGTFKISSPPFIFGYDSAELKESNSVIPQVVELMKKESSFLTLHISTNLSHLGGFQEYTQPVPNSENDMKITHLNTFVTEYLNEFPSRNISLTFIDSLGRNKCVTEFLQPIPIPDSEWFPKNPKKAESAMSKSSGVSKSSSSKSSRRKLSMVVNGEDRESEYSAPENVWKGGESKEDPLSKLVDTATRYVALIPTYEVSESHVVTLTGPELLKVLLGSHLDHTLLLASYFLHFGIRCWVVTGLALPQGLTSYVLVKYEHRNRIVMLSDSQKNRGFLARGDRHSKQFTWFVYDAVSGERFELRDASCPMKSVSFVFDSENIWVNIQTSQDCESMSFDFSKASDWQPVFENPLFLAKLSTGSLDRLYSAPPDIEQLRSVLESKVKYKVQKWRSHTKTVWNRYCGSLLREMLPHWEYWAFNPTEPRPVLGQRLKQLMVTHKMFGFPLNVPYINTKDVITSIKSTGVHLNDNPGVEFGLAVDVYAYPNNVLSVWVFLCSIVRI